MDERKLTGQQLIALFLAGCLLFNYPLLALFSQDGLVGGIPLLYVYIFITWALMIGLLATIIES